MILERRLETSCSDTGCCTYSHDAPSCALATSCKSIAKNFCRRQRTRGALPEQTARCSGERPLATRSCSASITSPTVSAAAHATGSTVAATAGQPCCNMCQAHENCGQLEAMSGIDALMAAKTSWSVSAQPDTETGNMKTTERVLTCSQARMSSFCAQAEMAATSSGVYARKGRDGDGAPASDDCSS